MACRVSSRIHSVGMNRIMVGILADVEVAVPILADSVARIPKICRLCP